MHETSTGREAPPSHARVLIVDADASSREALSNSVTRLGHTVHRAAAPGPAAVELPADVLPDLALIGLAAGETAGPAIETAARIVERFGVPVVYATETTDAELLDETQRTDPHGYVLKPPDPRQLVSPFARHWAREYGCGPTRRRVPPTSPPIPSGTRRSSGACSTT